MHYYKAPKIFLVFLIIFNNKINMKFSFYIAAIALVVATATLTVHEVSAAPTGNSKIAYY